MISFRDDVHLDHPSTQGTEPAKAVVTPPSLYSLTAHLLHHGLVTLDELHPHVRGESSLGNYDGSDFITWW